MSDRAVQIEVDVNGRRVTIEGHPMARLLDVLRTQLHLTGTKEGCGEGECGACSVLLDGRLVNSCLVPLAHASLLTGVAISLGTPWGLFKHYWVLTKLAITLVATLVLLVYMGTFGEMAAAAGNPAMELWRIRNPSPLVSLTSPKRSRTWWTASSPSVPTTVRAMQPRYCVSWMPRWPTRAMDSGGGSGWLGSATSGGCPGGISSSSPWRSLRPREARSSGAA